MALISCPECKRQVSDKALSCPGCGYPPRQEAGSADVSVASSASERPGRKPEDVLVTGPNGIALQEMFVAEFCSFIEWILDVKLSDDDQDYVRELMIKQWSGDDQLPRFFFLTGMAVFDEFKDAPKETREYWRDVFVFRFEDVSPFAPMSGLIRQICDRAKAKVRRKGLRITREICDAELTLRCFKAGVLSGTELELKSLPTAFKEANWKIGKEHPNAVIYKYLENILPVKLWPQQSEADRSSLERKWAEEAKESSLEGLVRFATRNQQMQRMPQAEQEVNNVSNYYSQKTQQAHNASLSDVLVGKQWQARSHTLAGQGLVIAFMRNGEFTGQLTGASYTTPAQPVKGKWQVIESQLFLDYVYNAQADSGFTVQIIPTSTQIQIQITQASASKLLGVDQFARAWEWERIG